MPEAAVRLLQRVVIALQAGQQQQELMQLALTLASTNQAELTALLVEDENLAQLMRLPFAQEVQRLSASVQALDNSAWDRRKRRQAEHIRQQLQQIAQQHGLPTSLQITRGPYLTEVLRIAHTHDAIFLTGQHATRQILQRPTAPRPVWVLLDNSGQSLQALHIGLALCQSGRYQLRPVLEAQSLAAHTVSAPIADLLHQTSPAGTALVMPELKLAPLLTALNRQAVGLLIMPQALLAADTELSVLEKVPCPVLLIQ